MNPINALLLANTFWSFKKELFFVLATFLMVLLLPVLTTISLTQAGIAEVSDSLASVNIEGHTIAIHDPTGKIIKEIVAKTIWPVHGTVTLEFGESDLPYQPVHTGIDIAGRTGDPVTPFMKGKVTYVGHLDWGYGNYIMVDNGNNISSLYGHLSKINVKVGEHVSPGDIIGLEGQTGWATGPHVHFETRVFGIPVNPRTFINVNLVPL